MGTYRRISSLKWLLYIGENKNEQSDEVVQNREIVKRNLRVDAELPRAWKFQMSMHMLGIDMSFTARNFLLYLFSSM